MRSVLAIFLAGCVVDLGDEHLHTPLSGDARTVCTVDAPPAIPLAFTGGTYWVFGRAGEIALDPCARTGVPTTPVVLDLTDAERAFEAANPSRRVVLTPTAGVVAGDVGWLFYTKTIVTVDAPDEVVGTGIARVDAPGAAATRLAPAMFADDVTVFWRHDVAWGASATLDGDGHVAIAGCRPSGPAGQCRVARAPIDAIADPRAWEYWGNGAWHRDPNAARDLGGFFAISPAARAEIIWNPYLDRWLLAYTGFFDTDVALISAPRHDLDDWSAEHVVLRIEGAHELSHAEGLDRDGGRVVALSYVHGDPQRTHWVEVALP